jgi:hypothetical protein
MQLLSISGFLVYELWISGVELREWPICNRQLTIWISDRFTGCWRPANGGMEVLFRRALPGVSLYPDYTLLKGEFYCAGVLTVVLYYG